MAVAATAALVVVLSTLWASVSWARHGGANNWRLSVYSRTGEWLARNSPEDATVATDEIGMIGYFGRRRILDLVGLVSPSSVPFASEGDLLGAFLLHPTRYVLVHSEGDGPGTGPLARRPWFAGAFREVASFAPTGAGVSVTVYERVPSAPIPAPRRPTGS